MFRWVITAIAIVSVAACSSEAPKSDHALALEAIKHADTKAVVAAFFDCLTDTAPKTPNGKDALDLDRINSGDQSLWFGRRRDEGSAKRHLGQEKL